TVDTKAARVAPARARTGRSARAERHSRIASPPHEVAVGIAFLGQSVDDLPAVGVFGAGVADVPDLVLVGVGVVAEPVALRVGAARHAAPRGGAIVVGRAGDRVVEGLPRTGIDGVAQSVLIEVVVGSPPDGPRGDVRRRLALARVPEHVAVVVALADRGVRIGDRIAEPMRSSRTVVFAVGHLYTVVAN